MDTKTLFLMPSESRTPLGFEHLGARWIPGDSLAALSHGNNSTDKPFGINFGEFFASVASHLIAAFVAHIDVLLAKALWDWTMGHLNHPNLPVHHLPSNPLHVNPLPAVEPAAVEALESKSSTFLSSFVEMEKDQKVVAAEEPKVDLFEDDDEFEEFNINQEWDDKEEGKEATQQWEDDWDDDDVNDDFSVQLKKELESNMEK